jgi:hypothetical protein
MAHEVLTREILETWVKENYPEVEPQEKRSYYRSGDDPWVDERDSQLSALEDMIDYLFPD